MLLEAEQAAAAAAATILPSLTLASSRARSARRRVAGSFRLAQAPEAQHHLAGAVRCWCSAVLLLLAGLLGGPGLALESPPLGRTEQLAAAFLFRSERHSAG